MYIFIVCSLLLCCNRWHQQETAKNIIFVQDETAIETSYRDYRDHIDNYNPGLRKLFEVEGNFTNSGNKELLVFYDQKIRFSGMKSFIHSTYCFVFDSLNEYIQSVYEVPYGSLDHDNFIREHPLEELGRDVIWRDKRIGCIGDFNENGKEELYFLSTSGMSVHTYFLEFDGYEFVEITDISIDYMYDSIIDVDKENKIIKFGKPWLSSDVSFSIIWNPESQRYVLLEGKYYNFD